MTNAQRNNKPAYGILALLTACALFLGACAGHASTTKTARDALDHGNPGLALIALNEQLEVETGADLPNEIEADDYLYLLDRSSVQQALDAHDMSSRDLEIADKGIEILDFSTSTLDDIGKFVFSDDTGVYRAPAYEKLMINTMNMMNYLARHDLNGARIEARRLAVMQKFIADHGSHGKSMLGPGSYLAGFTFEKSRKTDEAIRYYDEALQTASYNSLADPICRLGQLTSHRSDALNKVLTSCSAATTKDPENATPAVEDESGELLVIVNYGRVPAKEAKRIPVGLALTMAAKHISPTSRRKANELAAQGLVTWVNFPTMGKTQKNLGVVNVAVDGKALPVEGILEIDQAAWAEWKQVQGPIIASAITRMITRVVAGQVAKAASGGGLLGNILSLGTQVTMTVADTPDTRSWSMLPAKIAFARVRLPPGKHSVKIAARGANKVQEVELQPKGWNVVTLTVLR